MWPASALARMHHTSPVRPCQPSQRARLLGQLPGSKEANGTAEARRRPWPTATSTSNPAPTGCIAYSAAGSSHCTGTKYVGQWGEICTPLWVGKTANDYPNGAEAAPAPSVANSIVYIGDRKGEVYAFNASTGALKWSYATGGAIDASVAVAGDSATDAVALVGCSNGVTGQTCAHSLFAFKAASGGSPLWTVNTGGSVDNPPILADAGSGSNTGAAYVTSGNQVFAYTLPTSS